MSIRALRITASLTCLAASALGALCIFTHSPILTAINFFNAGAMAHCAFVNWTYFNSWR